MWRKTLKRWFEIFSLFSVQYVGLFMLGFHTGQAVQFITVLFHFLQYFFVELCNVQWCIGVRKYGDLAVWLVNCLQQNKKYKYGIKCMEKQTNSLLAFSLKIWHFFSILWRRFHSSVISALVSSAINVTDLTQYCSSSSSTSQFLQQQQLNRKDAWGS